MKKLLLALMACASLIMASGCTRPNTAQITNNDNLYNAQDRLNQLVIAAASDREVDAAKVDMIAAQQIEMLARRN